MHCTISRHSNIPKFVGFAIIIPTLSSDTWNARIKPYTILGV